MMDHSRLDIALQPRLQSLSTYINKGQKIQNLRGKTQNSKAVLFLQDPGNEVDLRRAKNLPKLIGKKVPCTQNTKCQARGEDTLFSDQNGQNLYPFSDLKRLKTIPSCGT